LHQTALPSPNPIDVLLTICWLVLILSYSIHTIVRLLALVRSSTCARRPGLAAPGAWSKNRPGRKIDGGSANGRNGEVTT